MSSQKPSRPGPSKWGQPKWGIAQAAGALMAKPKAGSGAQKSPVKPEGTSKPSAMPPVIKPRVSVVQPHARYHLPRQFGGAERVAAERDRRLGILVVAGVIGIALLMFGSKYAGLWEETGPTAVRDRVEIKRPAPEKAPSKPQRSEPPLRKSEKPGSEPEAQVKLALEQAARRIREEAEKRKAREAGRPTPPPAPPIASSPTPTRPNLADTDCQMSKPASAVVPACSAIIAQHNDYADAYFIRAWALRERNQLERALTDFNRAIVLQPTQQPAYYSQRALTYVRMRDFDRGLEDYNKAIELNPRSPTFHNDRGAAYLDLKDYARALADFNQAIEIDPRYAVPYNNRARTYVLSAGDHAKATADLDRAIELSPKYALAFENRGLSHLELRDLPKALADFDSAIALNPRSPRALNARGVAYERQGNRDRAIVDYRRALEVDQNFTTARENLTRLGVKI
jgi:tetratricopeptide (TPR) repeat protein